MIFKKDEETGEVYPSVFGWILWVILFMVLLFVGGTVFFGLLWHLIFNVDKDTMFPLGFGTVIAIIFMMSIANTPDHR